MKNYKNLVRPPIGAILICIALFFSCEIYDDTDYKITLMINCMGGTGQGFTFNLIADDYTLDHSDTGNFMWIFDEIKTLTITATKSYDDAALEILILENDKVVQTGFLNANYPSSSDVTNTLVVVWEKSETTDTSSTDSDSTTTSSSTSGS